MQPLPVCCCYISPSSFSSRERRDKCFLLYPSEKTTNMGRNKYSQSEILAIAKLLKLKERANRLKQKAIRHELRVDYEFNISDFNEPGKNFGLDELYAAIERRAILILDDATIANMKAKRERDKRRDAEDNAQQPETSDWQKAMKEWEDYYKKQQ